jgi:hypothetical protein
VDGVRIVSKKNVIWTFPGGKKEAMGGKGIFLMEKKNGGFIKQTSGRLTCVRGEGVLLFWNRTGFFFSPLIVIAWHASGGLGNCYLLAYRKMEPFCLGTPNHFSRATNYAEYISLL